MSFKQIHPLAGEATPEEIYTAKFEWLMRWAMYFCGNDRHAAEDLVQDTFTQMLTSWDQIRNLDQPEQFLYSCLRYGFLRQRRLGRRFLTEELTAVDYESMLVGARHARGHEDEWQNDLRAVVGYLCWRKESVRSASLLLLRFFHGYFPAEIARIAILPRSAIYDAIDYSRQETKAYLKDPKKLVEMRRGAPPVPKARATILAEHFVQELSSSIFASCHSPCKPASFLLERYEQGAEVPIDHHLLAHLASCRVCLDLVSKRFDLPPSGSRSLDHALAPAPRARQEGPRAVMSSGSQARSLETARRRCEEARQHRPNELVLFVNGRAVAARDIRSEVNELVVDLAHGVIPDFLEVVSEQGLILFSTQVDVPLVDRRREQVFQSNLIDDRTLRLTVNFSVSGAQVRMRYADPLFARAGLGTGSARELKLLPGGHAPQRIDRLGERWRAWVAAWSRPSLLASGMALLLLGGVTMLRYRNISPAPAFEESAQTVLAHSIGIAGVVGVEQQRVRINAAGSAVVVLLHRDLVHHREPRRSAVPEISPALHRSLLAAGMLWSDPLSAASFRDWRTAQEHAVDSVSRNEGLLTLTTRATGTVHTATLTVRVADWHPVARSAHLADGEVLEVAELEDFVIPWQRSSPDWFTAETRPRVRVPSGPARTAHVVPTREELDEAELGALLVLARAGADSTERVQVSRAAGAIVVTGLVQTEARRDQFALMLADLPYVTAHILTFDEAESALPAGATGPVLTAVSSPAAISPFDQWLVQQHFSLPDVMRMHAALFRSASAMRQSETGISRLQHSFNPRSLTGAGRVRYELLERLYLERIDQASIAQAKVLGELQVTAEAVERENNNLIARVDEDATVCLRLLSGSAEAHEDTPLLLRQLSTARAGLETQLRSTIAGLGPSSSSVGVSREEAPHE